MYKPTGSGKEGPGPSFKRDAKGNIILASINGGTPQLRELPAGSRIATIKDCNETCLESIVPFENEEQLNKHIEEKHPEFNTENDTIIIEGLGEIMIPLRNTKEEILKIIDFYKDDIDILYELLDFVEKY